MNSDLMVEGESKVEIHGLTCEDFIYCEDCKEWVSLWGYSHNLKDAGHNKCHWRYVTTEELRECVKDCEEYIPYCPSCDAIVDYELSKENPSCSCCGERLHESTVVWRNLLDEEK